MQNQCSKYNFNYDNYFQGYILWLVYVIDDIFALRMLIQSNSIDIAHVAFSHAFLQKNITFHKKYLDIAIVLKAVNSHIITKIHTTYLGTKITTISNAKSKRKW